MPDEKYVVPEELTEAARIAIAKEFDVFLDSAAARFAACATVKAVLRYQAEHPMVPTDEQLDAIHKEWIKPGYSSMRRAVMEWDRIKYLAPEPTPRCW